MASYLEDSYGCGRGAKPSRREKRNGGLLVLSPTPLLERAEKFGSVFAKKGHTAPVPVTIYDTHL
jgi:hypothetical protein